MSEAASRKIAAPVVPPLASARAMRPFLNTILSRSSIAPKTLIAPGPTHGEIQVMIAAATMAPDHDLLRPWRFILIEGDGRNELAKAFMAIRKQRTPDIRPEELNRTWRKTMRAPTLLAVIARMRYDNPRVPAHEQYVAIGAATYAVMLTCHALGYGAIMLSGSRSRHPMVHELFGLGRDEHVVGFISMGTPAKPIAPKRRAGATEFLQVWRGSAP